MITECKVVFFHRKNKYMINVRSGTIQEYLYTRFAEDIISSFRCSILLSYDASKVQ